MKSDVFCAFHKERISPLVIALAVSFVWSTCFMHVSAANLPTIEEFFPKSGPDGEQVLIRGENLAGTIKVEFNGVSARFDVVGDINPLRMMVIAWAPQNATAGPITVTTQEGAVSSAEPFVFVEAKPVIDSFSPDSGPPGTQFFIYGQNLKYATAVWLNGQPTTWGPGIDPVNIYLMARVPTNVASGPITVISPYGTNTSASSFTVTAPPALTVENWPVQVGAGMLWQLTVNDTFGINDVQLNGVSIPFTAFGPTDLVILIPTNAVSGYLSVLTATEVVRSPEPVTVQPAPVIRAVQPESGPPGAVVQLLGEHLENVTGVWIGEAQTVFTLIDPNTLSLVVPNRATGGAVSVSSRYSRIGSDVDFAITSGVITTAAGTIRGSGPAVDPVPIRDVTPTSGGTPGAMQFVVASPLKAAADWTSPGSAEIAVVLSASPAADDSLRLSWPVATGQYLVEMAEDLASGGWVAVPQIPVTKNGRNQIVIRMDTVQRFFRLAPVPVSPQPSAYR